MAPLLGELRDDTGLSPAMAGLLTTLPVLCFGAFAPLAFEGDLAVEIRLTGLDTPVEITLPRRCDRPITT